MNTSKVRNWHKSRGRSSQSELSTAFPVSVQGSKKYVSITFQLPMGKRIEFTLSPEDSALFLMQVGRLPA